MFKKGESCFNDISLTVVLSIIKNMNLAPRKGLDMYISVNADIRKEINKKGGDLVVVTMQREADNKLTYEDDIIVF